MINHTPGALLCLFILGLAFSACTKSEEAPTKRGFNPVMSATVETIEPRTGALVVHREYSGELSSDAIAFVSSEITGQVREVRARLGDRVNKGDVLAVVDPVQYEQRVREGRASVQLSQASVEEARAHLANLQNELDRKRPLLARQLVTEREIEALEAQILQSTQRIEVARAQVEQSRARLQTAQDQVRFTRLRAPFEGVVADRTVDVGSYVNPGQSLFQIVGESQIYLRIRIPESDSGMVHEQMDAQLRVDALGGVTLSGVVGRIAPALDPATRTLRVDIFPPEGSDWERVKPGMFGRAQLILGEREVALTLPSQALLKDRDGSFFVWLVQEEKAVKTPVTPGLRSREEVEIIEGLQANDEVVFRGYENLRDGQSVTVLDRVDRDPEERRRGGQ